MATRSRSIRLQADAIAHELLMFNNEHEGSERRDVSGDLSKPPAQKKVHVCKLCEKTFSRAHSLNCHMNLHNGEKPYKCLHPNCKHEYADRSNLRSHQRSMGHNDWKHKCATCGMRFSQEVHMKRHRPTTCRKYATLMEKKALRTAMAKKKEKSQEETAADAQLNRLTPLRKRTTEKSTRNEHNMTKKIAPKRETVNQKNPLKSVENETSKRGQHSKDLKAPSKKKRHICKVCNKTFSRAERLKGHMNLHNGEKPFKCLHANCKREFADRSNLRSHQRSLGHNDWKHKCATCGMRFSQEVHMKRHRPATCRKYATLMEKKALRTAMAQMNEKSQAKPETTTLKVNVKHELTEEVDNVKDIAESSFMKIVDYKGKVKQETYSDSDEKAMRGIKFQSNGGVKVEAGADVREIKREGSQQSFAQLVSQEPEPKEFRCAVKSEFQLTQLPTKNLRIRLPRLSMRTIEKYTKSKGNSAKKVAHVCKVCHKNYSRAYSLKNHMHLHSANKPYKCPVDSCNYEFADRSNLRAHQRSKGHNDWKYKCATCNKTFSTEVYLKRHLPSACFKYATSMAKKAMRTRFAQNKEMPQEIPAAQAQEINFIDLTIEDDE